jgi:hypothetical protein
MDLLWRRLQTTAVQVTTLKHLLAMSSYHTIVAIFL